MKIKNIFLSLSLVVLLGASALAQSGNDVMVKIVNKEGKVIATSNLDRNGNFNFPNLPAGDYTMKVSVQDFHFLKMTDGDKGTNSQNSTGRKGIQENGKTEGVAIPVSPEAQNAGKVRGSITQKMSAVERVAKVDSFTIKMHAIEGAAASDFHIKFKGDLVASEKATSGLKDTLKTQVRTAQPSQVRVDSWSWGTSNATTETQRDQKQWLPANFLTYTTQDEAKLKEGVDIKISVKEKHNLVGHVTVVK